MKHASIVALVSLLLSGCVGLQPYPFKQGQSVALVDVGHVPAAWMCTDEGRYSLVPDKQKLAIVPAGKRISVFSFVYIQGYQMNWTCAPGISFTPAAGTRYYGNVEIANQACRMEVYKGGADNRVGLDIDTTIGPGYCPAPAK